MNQQRLQQEPSMEEILASIRRIISEDEAASNKSRAPTGPTMPASANGTPGGGAAPTRRPDSATPVKGNVFSNNKATASPNGGHQNGKALPAPASDDAQPGVSAKAPGGTNAPTYVAEDFTRRDYDPDYGEDAVLDLTEMVAEDGSVVTIAPVSPDGLGEGQGDDRDDDRNGVATYDNGGAYDDTLYSDPDAYTSAYDENGQAGTASDDGYSEWTGDRDDRQGRSTQEDYDDYPEPETAQTGHEPAPATARVLSEGSREAARVEVVQRDDPRTVPASRNAVRLNTALAALAGGDAARGDEGDRGAGDDRDIGDARGVGDIQDIEDDRDIRGEGAGDQPDDAYDEMPEADATGAYDDQQAAAAATQGATAEYLESSALENMIRETMKPMLREWLDNNLTRLVEDVAREELHRMIESRGGL